VSQKTHVSFYALAPSRSRLIHTHEHIRGSIRVTEHFPIRTRFGVENDDPSVTLIDVFSACVSPVRMGSFVQIWHRMGSGYGKGFVQKKSTHAEISAGNRLSFLENPTFGSEISACVDFF
jgi:hypothetical protein